MGARVVCQYCDTPRSVRRDKNVVVHKHPATGRRCLGSERPGEAMPLGPPVIRTGFETESGASRYAAKRKGIVRAAMDGEVTPCGDAASFVVEEVRNGTV